MVTNLAQRRNLLSGISVRGGRVPCFKLLVMGAILALTATLLTACESSTAHFTIEARDNLTFAPDTVIIKPGQSVELTLVNNGKLDHTFTAPDLNIEVILRPGETKQVTFTAPQMGEYRFYSATIQDFETMKGTIKVASDPGK